MSEEQLPPSEAYEPPRVDDLGSLEEITGSGGAFGVAELAAQKT